MPISPAERETFYQDRPEQENPSLSELRVALQSFQKLKNAYGPLKPTQPYSPYNVFGDIQRFANQGYFESVIDANEHGALLSLASEIQMILGTV